MTSDASELQRAGLRNGFAPGGYDKDDVESMTGQWQRIAQQRALADALGPRADTSPVTIQARADDLADLALTLAREQGAHFTDLFVEPDSGGMMLRALLAVPQGRVWRWLFLTAPLTDERFAYTALTPSLPVADWYERELWDETGILPEGHPALQRLRLPAGWPPDERPWRAQGFVPEATSEAGVPGFESGVESDEELPALESAPEGVVDYPLGPVRSGVVESGHYTLRTVGEEIVDIRLKLFYKHRGVERRAEGLAASHLPLLAERISGTSGFAHALAVCEAIERVVGITAPPRARFLRVIFAELERLYNHLGYHADLCQATGLAVGQAQLDILKERVLRLNARLTGHRYLFGVCVPGGVAYDPQSEELRAIQALVSATRARMRRLGRMLLDSPSHVDRLEGTGILPPDEALAMGMVGPNGRASGVDRDLRRDHPYAAYGELAFDAPVERGGDALARARVRLEEMTQSLHLIEQAITRLPSGPARLDASDLAPVLSASEGALTGAALGWVESPRGEGAHWARFGADGRVTRYRARPASFANAQAFPLCVPGRNILTDFPVIEQSWGLSFAGVDR